MKSLKNLLLVKSIAAAAVAASGIAAPAVSHAVTASSPANGMNCRGGYSPIFSGSNLTCKKFASVDTDLKCDQATFPTYVNRDGRGQDGNKDICIRLRSDSNFVDIPSTGVLPGVPGGGYVFAVPDTAGVARKVAKAGEDEAAALGLPVSGVQTVQSITFPEVNPGGAAKDVVHTQLHHYTFAIPAGSIVIGNPGPVSLPATATTRPFAPRPLP